MFSLFDIALAVTRCFVLRLLGIALGELHDKIRASHDNHRLWGRRRWCHRLHLWLGHCCHWL